MAATYHGLIQKPRVALKPAARAYWAHMEETTNQPDSLITVLSSINQNALWASCLWGAIASGYCVYGWKQKSMIPWMGGFGMTAACFMSSALSISVTCIAIMFATHWLLKRAD
jgi:hypothetical protein